jgi:hypothetical protein
VLALVGALVGGQALAPKQVSLCAAGFCLTPPGEVRGKPVEVEPVIVSADAGGGRVAERGEAGGGR